jgi:hypothetical protein
VCVWREREKEQRHREDKKKQRQRGLELVLILPWHPEKSREHFLLQSINLVSDCYSLDMVSWPPRAHVLKIHIVRY